MKKELPNGNNLYARFINLAIVVSCIFTVVYLYAKYKIFLSIEGAPEFVLVFLLFFILWNYRIKSRWCYCWQDKTIIVEVTYNGFKRMTIVVFFEENKIIEFAGWTQKERKFKCDSDFGEVVCDLAYESVTHRFFCGLSINENEINSASPD